MGAAGEPVQGVIDPSAVFAWLLPDEQPARATTDCLLALDAGKVQFTVPDLFTYECANILVVCLKRGRLDAEGLPEVQRFLRDLPLSLVRVPGGQEALTALARETGLSAYDAAYLTVAEAAGLPLISNDQSLVRVARERAVRGTL
ncbi:MAG: type II toxin-antitoxin system VapC family toxin [Opitutales bacterium]